MSWPVAVVIIVMVVVFGKVMSSRYRAQAGIIEDNKGNQQYIEKRDPEAEREIQELRERIKVLERIATDDTEAKRLANEIDDLRKD